jgi:hypothetical protein
MTTRLGNNNSLFFQNDTNGSGSGSAGLTRAFQTDAALNPNLFHYNTNVLNYYLLTPRVVVHSTSDRYRRAK